jgi:hypothetical protein
MPGWQDLEESLSHHKFSTCISRIYRLTRSA